MHTSSPFSPIPLWPKDVEALRDKDISIIKTQVVRYPKGVGDPFRR